MRSILALVLVLLALAGCAPASPSYTQLSMDQAIALMEDGSDFLLLDVRTEAEFAEGHIPGAICIPNEAIGPEAPAALPDQNQRIFIYCRSGNRSKQASQKLADLGYTNIYEFGGIRDWPGEIETE